MHDRAGYQPIQCSECSALLPSNLPWQKPAIKCPFCQAPVRDPTGRPAPQTPVEAALSAGQAAADERRLAGEEQLRQRHAEMRSRFQRELIEEEVLHHERSSLVVIVPAFDGKLTPLSDERKQRFLDRLEVMARDVFASDDPEDESESTAPTAEPLSQLPDHVVGNACATCRGACCSNGGEHAYFTRDVLRQRARQHGMKTAADLVAAYRERLPLQSNEGSCVFHTDQGCNLPSDMRSATCNAFICPGLDYLRLNPPGSDVVEIAIVSQRNGQRLRTTVVRSDR